MVGGIVVRVILQLVDPLLEPGVGVDLVVGHAGAEDIHQGKSLVGDAAGDDIGHVPGLARKGPGNVGGAGDNGQSDGIERHFDVAPGSGLGAHLLHGGGGGLAGRQSVDLVVHDDIGEVQVAAHGVHEVAQTDAVTVAIPAGDHHVHVLVGELDPGSHGHGPAMQAVDAIGMDVARQVGRAADPGDREQLLGLDAQFSGRHLDAPENTEIAAARTPVRIDDAFIGADG